MNTKEIVQWLTDTIEDHRSKGEGATISIGILEVLRDTIIETEKTTKKTETEVEPASTNKKKKRR